MSVWLSNGNDIYYAGEPTDVHGLKGNDNLYGTAFNDTLYGGRGSDYLVGGDGWDWLEGSFGNDELNGGPGDDQIYGGKGSDYILTGTGGDHAYGGYGNDWLETSNEFIPGIIWYNGLTGGPGNDTFSSWAGNMGERVGGDGEDLFYMRGYWDNVYAGDGNDKVAQITNGNVSLGRGSDFVFQVAEANSLVYAIGDLGRDTFATYKDTDAEPGGNFCIVDFQSGVDKLSFQTYDPNTDKDVSVADRLNTNGDGVLSVEDGYDPIAGNGVLLVNDGTTVAIQYAHHTVQLYGHTSAAISDFIVI